MTPSDIPEDDWEAIEGEDAEGQKKKKGKKEGEGAGGVEKRTVSAEALSFLSTVGATMEQIKRVLGQWAHLRGDALKTALNDFAKDIARASSQPQVQFDGKDVSIITTLFRYLTGQSHKPTMRPSADNSPKGGPR